eukprot:TRINITY_DN7420_c0_g1_i1.p1 TRINITY_DN7420_c0_g1~~TRINITY_DN7420_c0_g1_i1.p1  ORF type:complete len:552 (+),score=144.01 TRINITY_DN7420_c0_g1_i1:38-1693(+)
MENKVFCVECTDQPAELYCNQCLDDYCEVCFLSQHKKGMRSKHTYQHLKKPKNEIQETQNNEPKITIEKIQTNEVKTINLEKFMKEDTDYESRSHFIPLRINDEERSLLKLLISALDVSEYTDKVDVIAWTGKKKRILQQLVEICSILSGLMLAKNYKSGQKLVTDKDFKDNESYFQMIFELGRRFKIMNPEKMRTEYGKMLFMLQDAVSEDIAQEMEFSPLTPIKTVHLFLEKRGGLALLEDKKLDIAAKAVINFTIEGRKKSNEEIEEEKNAKREATKLLVEEYKTEELTEDDILLVINSISDSNSFLVSNRDPVDSIIYYLKKYFHETDSDSETDLTIRYGSGGSHLSHSHSTQYQFILQTFTLWREISQDMFKLWYCADSDLLDPSSYYVLRDTGQGLNRVQSPPRVRKLMGNILQRTMSIVKGSWIGLSVVHLGDIDVPNALVFIDKYTQVTRILAPIVKVVFELEHCEDKGILEYIEKYFGGVEKAKKLILKDFFTHGFDGSGDDGGSCIDGRLTSSWNWCSLLEKKSYYPLFLIFGFNGFDGVF